MSDPWRKEDLDALYQQGQIYVQNATASTASVPITQPEPAGWYVIGGHWGLKFTSEKRPRWLTRKLLWWLLEIRWEDQK